MSNSQKTWWAPVWRGLVADPTAKHYRQLDGALWLLIYLILHADRLTGVVRQKVSAIARATGISPWTLRDWLRRLRRGGYITLRGTGRAPLIQIRRWRTLIARHPPTPLRGTHAPIRGAPSHLSERASNGRNGELGRANSNGRPSPYKSIFTKVNLRTGSAEKKSSRVWNGAFRPRTREELLAADLAHGFQDSRNVSRYLQYAHRYPEPFLRRLLSEVRAVPEAKIKRSRAALFTYLLNHYVETHPAHPRD